MTISGIPLHPLVVHAAVVFAPTAALAALAYAVVPGGRAWLRHAAALVAVVAAASVQLAAMTGDTLASTLGGTNPLVQDHEAWAGRLQAATWVLAGIAVVAWWALPVRTVRAGQGGALLGKAVVVLLPLAAVAVLALVVMTGHSGAEAVWKGVGA
ncbi:DUF2231 domain-containing protein [Nocardioides jejuensis]|uniref:DUF2231 domain-containing protein n=1 Tax=Nocardioides jejuensis TaxID=2502782 RepID=A0A4V2P020_9ACTN|nr:DUF2231 domain-containing protein [Nocardioides jejuensis]TCJ31182.1 hypothetical protein EPD65_01015 [Nocardioides jejuensis]